MVVCRYYLQGKCRFGDRCRFEHPEPYPSYDDSYQSYNSNRKHNYGYDDDYNPYDNRQNRQMKYEVPADVSVRRLTKFDRQMSRDNSPNYYGSNDRYHSNQQITHNFDRPMSRDTSPNYYGSNDRYHSNQRYTHQNYNANTRSDYYSNKNSKSNNYEWVSEDYRNRQKQYHSNKKHTESPNKNKKHTESPNKNKKHTESPNKNSSNREISFSFKEAMDDNNEKLLFWAEVIKEDITAWELGKQWPFTCYYPFRDKHGIPGLRDVSFEELRYEALKAQENNCFDSYVQEIQKALQDINNTRNKLKEHSPELFSIINKLKAGKNLEGDMQTDGGLSFINSSEPTGVDISSAFAPASNTAASFSFKSVFDNDKSVSNAASSFSFKSPVANSASSFSFKLPANENTVSASVSSAESQIYTPLDQLSEQDREQFSASTFMLGKIPTLPPPKVLCF